MPDAPNKEVPVIADRIIEGDALVVADSEARVEVRMPWYRALPGSCISAARFSIDGAAVDADTLRWTMNGRTFTFDELRTASDEWWFPADSAVLSGRADIEPGGRHEVAVRLTLYIPYIIIGDGETLHIDEGTTKTLMAKAAS